MGVIYKHGTEVALYIAHNKTAALPPKNGWGHWKDFDTATNKLQISNQITLTHYDKVDPERKEKQRKWQLSLRYHPERGSLARRKLAGLYGVTRSRSSNARRPANWKLMERLLHADAAGEA